MMPNWIETEIPGYIMFVDIAAQYCFSRSSLLTWTPKHFTKAAASVACMVSLTILLTCAVQ